MAMAPVSVAEKTIRLSLSGDQRTMVPDDKGSIVISYPASCAEHVVNLLYARGVIIGLRPNRHVVRHFPPLEDD